ncbi:MAG TPA: DUF1573 domain-containing protein [Ignavibacteriales bacterium]|nr:DUF1573 domain-containing protein [Ignavibacteriales bacterium]
MFKKLFFTFIFISCLALAQQDPKVTVKPLSYDMGDIKQGDKVTKIYNIKNEGRSTLKITDVRASCGCTAAKPAKTELLPGESTGLEVTFNSTGRSGKQNKTVYIETNDPAGKSLQVTFTANVLTDKTPQDGTYPVTGASTSDKNKKTIIKPPKLSFTEYTHDFGRLNEGKIAQYTFKFTNAGGSALDIGFVVTTGSGLMTKLSSRRIEPGQKGTLKVSFDTSNLKGKVARNIKISTNDPLNPTHTLILTADVVK